MGLDLSGVAFVTGAGGSIGEACVLQFARDGVTRIAGADLSVTGLERTASALRKEYPAVNFISLMADLSDELQVQRVFQQIIKRFGRIDYAVNNAAIAAPLSPSSEGDFKALEKVLDVNLKGVWLCEREELKLMLTQELTPASLTGRGSTRGTIINVASVLGLLSVSGNAFYTMSKHGLIGLTKTDALDYAKKGIRINAVCPGFVQTPLLTPEIAALLKPNIEKTPMGRLAQPQEVADSITFLASERASYITGSSLVVDGGYLVH